MSEIALWRVDLTLTPQSVRALRWATGLATAWPSELVLALIAIAEECYAAERPAREEEPCSGWPSPQ